MRPFERCERPGYRDRLDVLGKVIDEADEFVPVDRQRSAVDLDPTTGNEDGRSSSFNNAGYLTFSLQFMDGTSGHFATPSFAFCLRGDTNGDEATNLGDIPSFVDAIMNSTTDPSVKCAADTNLDGTLDGRDIQLFTQCLTGGCP